MSYLAIFLSFLVSAGLALILTPIFAKIAIKFDIVDRPNNRKIHSDPKPYLGGLAIFFSAGIAYLIFWPEHDYQLGIILGAFIMLLIGFLDDKYDLKPLVKLAGQILAAVAVVSSGLLIEKFNLPFFGEVELNNISVIVTIVWIVAVSNAINLIDGLDGLAAGVATIALLSICIMAIGDGIIYVAILCAILIGANLGFLFYNFHPAKIYMGDSGALFLGYMISVISMLGLFKNVALFSFIIPLLILAVPFFDTIFAIVRRLRNGENIMTADRKHIHYQLLDRGISHRGAVVIIYFFSALFGLLAIFFSYSTLGASIIIVFIAYLLIHIIAEIVGLVLGGKQPVLNFFRLLLKSKEAGVKDDKK